CLLLRPPRRALFPYTTLFRSGLDWTDRMPNLGRAFRSRQLPDGWYDGEIVVLDAEGKPDFQALQNAFESGSRVAASKRAATRAPDRKSTRLNSSHVKISYAVF